MPDKKTTFALLFGNRGVFPSSVVEQAVKELPQILEGLGYGILMLGEEVTPHGAVESRQDGQTYANFLRDNRGKFDGVVLCLPNFGDETGAAAALGETQVPILVQAYPDDLDKLAPQSRRDAFCGKLSVMDVFSQYGIKFTALKPHVVSPTSDRFAAVMDEFGRICRVVKGMRGMVVGAIGARTTAFKTVRIDEVALQQNGITMETLDLSDVFARIKDVNPDAPAFGAKVDRLKEYAAWPGVPDKAFDNIARLGVVLDTIVEEYQMDALAFRCWSELQEQLGISPCILLGEMNQRGVTAACEVDVGSAVAMRALSLASGRPPICLDWNNNYGDAEDKCILFHCGSVAANLMTDRGRVTDHAIISNNLGQGRSFGCHVGRISPFDFTFSSMLTEAGNLRFYLGQGKFTNHEIPKDFFGCAGVAEIENLEDVLLHVGKQGFRHHVSVTPDLVLAPVREALEHYLEFHVSLPQQV
ncbi:MAG: hypothetical protein GY847_23950 [Proteobacteria bacterium]|nr:hypothetical protein [Pseudomonadota bacterium]